MSRSRLARRIVRVVACVAAPFDPGEVHEVAAVDVVVDGAGLGLEALSTETFAPTARSGDREYAACTPMHVATAIWGGRAPDVLATHDASTASLVFTSALTADLPLISTYKMARRVWPGQHSYDLDSLARWRARPGPFGPYSRLLASGARRDAVLSAGLLIELLLDPGLRDVAEAAWLDRLDWDSWNGEGEASVNGWDVLDAALVASALPSKPLRDAPFPFDDPREWSSVGLEDLRHHARFSGDECTAAAARAELRTRSARG